MCIVASPWRIRSRVISEMQVDRSPDDAWHAPKPARVLNLDGEDARSAPLEFRVPETAQ